MTTMTKKRVAELEDAQLDWAVGVAKGWNAAPSQNSPNVLLWVDEKGNRGWSVQGFTPSSRWDHGGPIIEREGIQVTPEISSCWSAYTFINFPTEKSIASIGKTPLIAAMRAFVASKLGDEVEVPE